MYEQNDSPRVYLLTEESYPPGHSRVVDSHRFVCKKYCDFTSHFHVVFFFVEVDFEALK